MHYKIIILTILLLTGCSSMPTSQETNTTVSLLLDEIQIAVNEIAKNTENNPALPAFKKAEVKLSTIVKTGGTGGAALVVSGEKSKYTSNSSILTLDLAPKTSGPESVAKSTGHEIAQHVIAAVKAVDQNGSLKLNSLTVEAGLEVKTNVAGGIEVELVGISIEGKQSSESINGNSLKLVFSQ